MKFLQISISKESTSTLPPSLLRQIIEADLPVINQQKKAGKLLEFYWLAGWSRAVAIREAKSAEEVNHDIMEMPCSVLMNHEVYPLANYEEVAKSMIERIKAAEKMMPAPPK